LDLSKQLQSYEVEYHVLKEEMMYSPQKGAGDEIEKLEQANHSLKHQNMELIEKLQHAHSRETSLEIMIHNCQTQETKLKSHIRTLELERSALLNAVSKLKQLVPERELLSLDINLPQLTPSMPISPVNCGKTLVNDGVDQPAKKEVKNGGTASKVAKTDKSSKQPKPESSLKKAKPDTRKSARLRPDRQS